MPSPSQPSTALDSPSQRAIPGASRAAALIGIHLFLAMLPVTMLVPALKELIGERYDAGYFWTHAFMSINMLGAVLVAPFFGILADSPGRRVRLASIALAADGLLLASMSLAPSLPWILAARFFEGAAHILALSALMALAGAWAAEHQRGRTMGIVGAAMMFGTALGTRLGGIVWHAAPDQTFLIAGALSILAAIGVRSFIRESESRRPSDQKFRIALALLADRKDLRIPFAYAFTDRLCVGVIISTLVLFLGEIHGLEPDTRSKLLVSFLLPFAALVYPAGRLVDRIGRVAPLCLGTIAFGVVFATYGFIPASILPVVMILSGVLSAIMFAPSLTLCADLAPPEHRAAVYTAFNVFGSLGFLLGPLIAGLCFSSFESRVGPLDAFRFTFIFTGALEILCGLLTLPALLRLRRQGLTR